jgi:hypothetical protein
VIIKFASHGEAFSTVEMRRNSRQVYDDKNLAAGILSSYRGPVGQPLIGFASPDKTEQNLNFPVQFLDVLELGHWQCVRNEIRREVWPQKLKRP